MSAADSAALAHRGSGQFGLGDIFVLLLACGAAFAEWRWLGGKWVDGISASIWGICVLLAIGTLHQAWDYWRTPLADTDSATRFGRGFAVGWRVFVVGLFATYCVLSHAERKFDAEGSELAGWPIDILPWMAAIVIISSTRQLAARRRESPTTPGRAVLVWVAGALYVSVVAFLTLQITLIVYVAICGIELYHSPIQHPFIEGLDPSVVRRAEPVFWLGCAAAACIPPAFVALYLAFKSNTRRGRILFGALWAATFAIMAGGLSWLCLVGLPQTSPLMWQQEMQGNAWQFGLIGVPCVVVLSLAAAYRWTALPNGTSTAAGNSRPPSPRGRYWHERPLVLLLLGLAIASDVLNNIVFENGFPNEFSWDLVGWYAQLLFVYDTTPAYLATAIIALQASWSGYRRGNLDAPQALPLPPRRFVLAATSFAATFLVALPVLAIYGFALWLSAWYVPYL